MNTKLLCVLAIFFTYWVSTTTWASERGLRYNVYLEPELLQDIQSNLASAISMLELGDNMRIPELGDKSDELVKLLQESNVSTAKLYLHVLRDYPELNEETFKLFMRAIGIQEIEEEAFNALLKKFGSHYFQLMENDGLVGPNKGIFERRLNKAMSEHNPVQEQILALTLPSLKSFTDSLFWMLGFLLFALSGTLFGGKVLPVEHKVPQHWTGLCIIFTGALFTFYWIRTLSTLTIHIKELDFIYFDRARVIANSFEATLNPFGETYGYGISMFFDSIPLLAPATFLGLTVFIGLRWLVHSTTALYMAGIILLGVTSYCLFIVEGQIEKLILQLCPGTFLIKLEILYTGTLTILVWMVISVFFHLFGHIIPTYLESE